jgi:phage baseplate assembly protein W
VAVFDYDLPAGVGFFGYTFSPRGSLGYELFGYTIGGTPVTAPTETPPPAALPFLLRTPRRPGPTGRAGLDSELGIDVGCVLDTDEAWSLVSGETNLAHALARRLSTPRGGLFYAPNYGLDLRSYLGADLTDTQLATLGPATAQECEKDERVQSCTVDLEFNFATETLSAKVMVTTATGGAFVFILAISDVTVELLDLTAL